MRALSAPVPFLLLLTAAVTLHAAEVSDADKRIVQTVQRLSSFNYAAASQKTKDAIGRYLDATAGSEEYFALVEKFSIASQSATLLKLATAPAAGGSGSPQSGQAVKLLLKLGQQEEVTRTLAGLPPDAAGALLGSIASVGTQEAVALALASVTAPATAPEVRLHAVKALGLSAAGQKALLEAARAGQLPADVREAAGTALTTSTDEAIRTEVAALFQMAAKKPLPPVAELAKRTGKTADGHTVFMTYCFTCHQVNGEGIDFGPALGEIGTKLAKEALYEAILKPTAAISFGYEGWEVKTKAGDTFTGMVASETPAELALRLPGGVIQKVPKTDVVSKTALAVSLMTPGLETVMEETQLVDLVEFLASLKKK
ncbi:MAG: c-type cytochrome [Verrucomicrobiota bacterium]